MLVPQELVDYIVDFLHDDRESLKACSLTCRRWNPSAQYHIFWTLCLRTEHQFTTLPTSTCTVPFHLVKHLQVFFIPGSSRLFRTPHPYWSRFTNVTRLTLSHFNISSINSPAFKGFIDNFPDVHTLNISHSAFHSFQSLISYVHSFPHMTNLYLAAVKWPQTQSVDLEHIQRSFKTPITLPLQRLDLDGVPPGQFIDVISKLLPNHDLHYFTINWVKRSSVVTSFIEKCANLRNLDLTGFSTEQLDAIDVRAHNHVQVIKFGPFEKALQVDEPWFPTVLTTLGSSHNVHTITFQINSLRIDFGKNINAILQSIQWRSIDSLSDGSEYEKWTKLRLELMFPVEHGFARDLRSKLEGFLPKLTARGIIEVVTIE